MKFFTFADTLKIPLAAVAAISYSRRARQIEHRNGFVTCKGYESTEISVRFALSRALCHALDIEFSEVLREFRELSVARSAAKGPVWVGGVQVLPTMEFAVTTVNFSESSDFCTTESAEIEIVFSPVGIGEKTAAPVYSEDFPAMTVLDLALDALRVPAYIQAYQQTESSTEIELSLGEDTDVLHLSAWVEPLLKFIKVPIQTALPSVQSVTACECAENLVRLSLGFFPAAAREVFTCTYTDTDSSLVLKDLARRAGVALGAIPSLPLAYYAVDGKNAVQALQELATGLGYLVDFHGEVLSVVSVPDRATLAPVELEEVESGAWERMPRVTGVRLSCGWESFFVGSHENPVDAQLPARLANPSDYERIGREIIKYINYNINSIDLTLPLDSRVIHHSPVKFIKGSEELMGLVENYQIDYCTAQMRLHVCIPE